MRKTSTQLGSNGLYNLWVNISSLPQVVFATYVLGTNSVFMRSLCKFGAQVSTQALSVFNRLFLFLYPLSPGLIVTTTKEN